MHATAYCTCTTCAWDSALIPWPDIRPVLQRAYAGMRDAASHTDCLELPSEDYGIHLSTELRPVYYFSIRA